MTWRPEGLFLATDGDGNEYRVLMFRKWLDASDEANSVWIGVPHYLTFDGRRVDRIKKGEYEVIARPKIPITSDDPSAP